MNAVVRVIERTRVRNVTPWWALWREAKWEPIITMCDFWGIDRPFFNVIDIGYSELQKTMEHYGKRVGDSLYVDPGTLLINYPLWLQNNLVFEDANGQLCQPPYVAYSTFPAEAYEEYILEEKS